MRTTITKIILVSSFFAFPAWAGGIKCGAPCTEADTLEKNWAATKDPEKVGQLSKESNELLKKLGELNKRSIDRDVVHAMVKVLATIYLHDDDPLDDEMERLRPTFKKKPFRKIWDEEVAKLPGDQKEKLMVGINYVDHAPPNEDGDFE